MERSRDFYSPTDEESNFQRTPSYRIATVNGQKSGSYPVPTKTRSTDDHLVTYAPYTSPVPQNQVWGRRNSYTSSTASDLSNITWPAVITYSAMGVHHPVQPLGIVKGIPPVEVARPSRSPIQKLLRILKSFMVAFLARPDDGHTKNEMCQLVDEPDPKYLRRWVSLWLTWIIMFILVLQFSMYSSTLGTYLPLIDPTSHDDFAPWAIAAFGFGQTFACPVFGWWSNYIKNNRLPMAVGVLLMIVGNIGYCFVELFPPTSRGWLIFAFRVIIGVGGGIAGVIRAYCATAARPHEYTKAVTGATAGLSLAIMAGPGAQALFAPIGYPGISLGLIRVHMYNAPALVSILIGIVCMILLYTVLVQEYPGLAKDETKEKDPFFVLPKYDMCAAWVVIACWFAAYLCLTSFVMIGKSYTMVMFHWSYVEAIVDNGIIMGVFACISLVLFIIYAYHGKKFDERFLMYVGIAMMCLYFMITFPWPGLPRLHQECGELPCCNSKWLQEGALCVDLRTINKTNLMEISHTVAMRAKQQNGESDHDAEKDNVHQPGHDDFPGGCQAVKYKWCESTTREPIGLYMGTFFLLATGFPLANCAFSALFSKIIGPRRQGFMQGVIISGGAAARTSGPIFINYTFDWWGPRVSWGLTATILMASLALSAAYYWRLVPLNPKPKLNPGEHFRYKKGVLYRF